MSFVKKAPDKFCAFLQKAVNYIRQRKTPCGFSDQKLCSWEQDQDIPSPTELCLLLEILKKENQKNLLQEFNEIKNKPVIHTSERFYYFFVIRDRKKFFPNTIQKYLLFSQEQ